jgi:DNA ligase D-like protein (predicted polymerase)
MSMSARGRAAAGGEEYLVVDGQELRLTNPARVLFPVTGTTKADVIAYYTAVAGVMLPHLLGRPATRKRWPDGVEGPSFFVKEVEAGIPVWLSRVQVAQRWGGKFYPVLDTPAALAWVGQVSALEVHVPQWRIGEPAGPRLTGSSRPEVLVDRVVFDLDPGEGAGLPECVDVAWALRERLGPLGNRMVPVTSGSKGLHLYVPMDAPISSEQASEWAWLAATQLEKAMPALVVSTMAKSERRGKVLVDWSQNNAAKTTIAPYSLRGRERPTVAAPRTWDELTRVGLRHLELGEVLERVAGGLDPMATLAPASPLSVVAPVVVRERRPRTARTVVGSKRRRSSDAVVLPAGLAGPVDVALAQAQDRVPGPRALPGGSTYEPKWDGFRLAVVGHAEGTRLWSKSGTDLTARFPEITAAAAAAVPEGTVLDGEVVIWVGDRLDFGLLQRRFTSSRARLADEARQHPASYMVARQHRGESVRQRPGPGHADQGRTGGRGRGGRRRGSTTRGVAARVARSAVTRRPDGGRPAGPSEARRHRLTVELIVDRDRAPRDGGQELRPPLRCWRGASASRRARASGRRASRRRRPRRSETCARVPRRCRRWASCQVPKASRTVAGARIHRSPRLSACSRPYRVSTSCRSFGGSEAMYASSHTPPPRYTQSPSS